MSNPQRGNGYVVPSGNKYVLHTGGSNDRTYQVPKTVQQQYVHGTLPGTNSYITSPPAHHATPQPVSGGSKRNEPFGTSYQAGFHASQVQHPHASSVPAVSSSTHQSASPVVSSPTFHASGGAAAPTNLPADHSAISTAFGPKKGFFSKLKSVVSRKNTQEMAGIGVAEHQFQGAANIAAHNEHQAQQKAAAFQNQAAAAGTQVANAQAFIPIMNNQGDSAEAAKLQAYSAEQAAVQSQDAATSAYYKAQASSFKSQAASDKKSAHDLSQAQHNMAGGGQAHLSSSDSQAISTALEHNVSHVAQDKASLHKSQAAAGAAAASITADKNRISQDRLAFSSDKKMQNSMEQAANQLRMEGAAGLMPSAQANSGATNLDNLANQWGQKASADRRDISSTKAALASNKTKLHTADKAIGASENRLDKAQANTTALSHAAHSGHSATHAANTVTVAHGSASQINSVNDRIAHTQNLVNHDKQHQAQLNQEMHLAKASLTDSNRAEHWQKMAQLEEKKAANKAGTAAGVTAQARAQADWLHADKLSQQAHKAQAGIGINQASTSLEHKEIAAIHNEQKQANKQLHQDTQQLGGLRSAATALSGNGMHLSHAAAVHDANTLKQVAKRQAGVAVTDNHLAKNNLHTAAVLNKQVHSDQQTLTAAQALSQTAAANGNTDVFNQLQPGIAATQQRIETEAAKAARMQAKATTETAAAHKAHNIAVNFSSVASELNVHHGAPIVQPHHSNNNALHAAAVGVGGALAPSVAAVVHHQTRPTSHPGAKFHTEPVAIEHAAANPSGFTSPPSAGTAPLTSHSVQPPQRRVVSTRPHIMPQHPVGGAPVVEASHPEVTSGSVVTPIAHKPAPIHAAAQLHPQPVHQVIGGGAVAPTTAPASVIPAPGSLTPQQEHDYMVAILNYHPPTTSSYPSSPPAPKPVAAAPQGGKTSPPIKDPALSGLAAAEHRPAPSHQPPVHHPGRG